MSIPILSFLIVLTVAGVVIAIAAVLLRASSTRGESRVAIVCGLTLALWATLAGRLAYQGFFRPPAVDQFPPIGTNLIVVALGLTLCLVLSPPLRRLLGNQEHLIWLNVWRLLGIVFLILYANGQLPALWALPSGIGDVLVGATAPFVVLQLKRPDGKIAAILFNIFGMADLVVAVTLGVMTNPGPAQIFHTRPASDMLTAYPLALVPVFLVPLAFMLHVASLWQLLRGSWKLR